MSIKQISEINNNQNSVDKTNYNNNINVTNSDNLNLDTTTNIEEMDLDVFLAASSSDQYTITNPITKLKLIKELEEKYNINIGILSEIEYVTKTDEATIYNINGQEVDFYNDGRIEIGFIDATGANEITIKKDEIIIETKNGTFNFTKDNKTSYVDLDGNSHTINCSIIEILSKYSELFNDNYNLIDINKITIDKEGKLCYLDNEIFTDKAGNICCLDKATNSKFIFDDIGRITTFIQGDVRVDYNYNPTKEDLEEIKNMDSLYEDGNYKVNYVATITIRGHKMKSYSIGEQDNPIQTIPIQTALTYSLFNDRILKLIEKEFKGLIIGPWELSHFDEKEEHDGVAAYANYKNKYIFTPYDGYVTTTAIHEMGHVIQSIMEWMTRGRDNDINMWDDLYDLYNKDKKKYAKLMATLEKSGYRPPTYEQSPNEEEFFADATANYFLNPEELKRYAPEIYEFLDNVYGEKEVYEPW